MKKVLGLLALAALFVICDARPVAAAESGDASASTQQSGKMLNAGSMSNTATGAANTTVTATLPATASCIYVTDVYIAEIANAAVTGAAGPAEVCTTTGLANNITWWGDNATFTTGQLKIITDHPYGYPLKVNPGTAFTIGCTGGQSTYNVRVTIQGYSAPC